MLENTYFLRSTLSPINLPWASFDNEADRPTGPWIFSVNGEGALAEFVLTPFHREYWRDLYQIKLTARNRPGVFAAVAEILKQVDINILCSNGTESGDLFHLRLTVDCRRYASTIDGRMEDRVFRDRVRLPHLQMLLETHLIERLDFFGGSPSLAIERNETLWKLHHQAAKNQLELDYGRQLALRCGVVTIPRDLIRNARAHLAQKHGAAPGLLRSSIQTASVDETGMVVRVLLTFEELAAMKVSLSCANLPGALATITEWLRENDYDLTVCKQMTSGNHRRNTAAMVIRDLRAKNFDVAAVKERFAAISKNLPAELARIGLRITEGRHRHGKNIPRPFGGDSLSTEPPAAA